MKRFNARRLRRALALVKLPDCPADWPDDVRALGQMAEREGPALLAGHSPEASGLLVIHPASKAWPLDLAPQGHAAVRVVPLPELLGIARELAATLTPRPGWFPVLLVGARHVGSTRLGPVSLALQEVAS